MAAIKSLQKKILFRRVRSSASKNGVEKDSLIKSTQNKNRSKSRLLSNVRKWISGNTLNERVKLQYQRLLSKSNLR